jgi:ankyrin repeat protein
MIGNKTTHETTTVRTKVPLVDLVYMGQMNAVKDLIEKLGSRLDINEKDKSGNFAAMMAAERNDLPMLKLLADNGADLSLTDGRGRSVKGWAMKHNNSEMLELIEEALKKHNLDQMHLPEPLSDIQIR